MKKIFLIPLMALFSCVMAFADNAAKIGDVEYETLQAAVDAVTDAAATITLIDDVEQEGTIVTIAAGKIITLDLNGRSLSSTAVAADEGAVPAIVNEGVLHLQGAGSISSPNNIAIYNGDPDNLSWLGFSSPKRRAMARKAMLENDDPTEPWITFSGSFNVNSEVSAVLNFCLSFSTEEPSENITFLSDYTGQVTGSVEDAMGTKGHIKVNGGKFSEDISKNATIAEEYHIELVEDWYVLVEGAAPKVYVAQVGDTQYESFKEAFEAIANMDAEGYTEQTVTLLMDVDLAPADSWDDELDNQINKSVTLDLNGHNITAALPSSYRCIFRMTHYDATLTITGNGQFIMTAEVLWGDPWTLSFENIIDNMSDSHIVLNGGSYPVAPVASYMPMGYTASLTEGYYVVAEDNNDPRKLFNDYITGNSSELFTVSANTDMSGYGPYQITGTKNIKVNDGVTLKLHYKYDDNIGNGSPLYVANGGSLTLTGNGTIVSNVSPIYVVNGGSLTIGATDGSDALNINTVRDANEFYFQKDYAIENHGVATIYNVVMDARSNAIYNRADGEMYIKKATIVGHSNSVTDTNGRWAYAVINGGKMVMNNASVTGIHGAVSCESGNGTLELHNCDLKAKNLDNNGGVHYALYVCTKAMVSAYNTKFYSDNASYTIFIGDNDSQNSFGLIYLYDGCKSNRKLFVQQKRGQDDDILFPVLVSENSEWYTLALNGGKDENGKLLPANCEYVAINEGEDGYAAGYRYKVVNNATDQKEASDAPAATIPWQLEKTWNASASETSKENVPVSTTIVTIPAEKEVIVKKDANLNPDAVAEQIFIGDGAKLTVEAGTTLTVGDGGVNIANGGQMIVKDGAVVRVGKSGLVTTEEEALVIENTQTKAGVFMIDPAVTENTQPKATVKLESKAYHDETNDIFHWQHFAIPTVGVPDEFKMPVQTAIYDLDENNAWKTLSGMSELGTPFKGYNLTNWATAKGTVYEFYGNIIGNGDGKANFTGRGYNFCGNSYTAPIDIVKMLQDIKNNTTVDVEPTITIYDTENDKYQAVTVASIENASWMGTPVFTQIAPMQGFFLNLRTNEAGEYEVIDYSNSVWGNPSIATGGMLAPARHEANDNKGIRMVVAANGREDDVLMVESEDYTATFDDGADATKKMSERSFNLYANINNEKQAVVATNNMENTILGFESVEGGEYTIRFYTNDVEGEYYLLDIVTGAKMAIANDAEYKFAQDANVANAARFEIVSVAKVTTSIENVEEAAKATGIYTITGQYIGRDFTILPAGVYVINGQKVVK
jgi:hypothetical protein